MAADHRSGLLALNRFGLGGRADGDLAAASGDPRGFLLADLKDPGLPLLAGPDLPTTPAALKALFANEEAKRLARERDATARSLALAPPVPLDHRALDPSALSDTKAAEAPMPAPETQVYRAEALARFRRAYAARAGFVERLVAFWSNHFCVSVAKAGFVRVAAGAFEREAVRPHVLGRFSDMLLAVESHPAMIVFLDNQLSAGADSRAGRQPGRGLNENLGREILELHTLGVDGGYSQADVTALANIVTGWTYAGREGKNGDPGSSLFFASYHQPGSQLLLGRPFPQDGRAQGEAALDMLARHPATARHLATKLARHFVADDPPPVLVTRLAETFARTEGDLRAVAAALVNSPEAWDATAPKTRDPWQFLVAAMRLTGREPVSSNPALGALAALGQPLWSPPGPNGFSDASAAWVTAEGMKARLDVADAVAARIADGPNPLDLLEAIAGNAARPETRTALARAATKRQALALLLMSPEMQRR